MQTGQPTDPAEEGKNKKQDMIRYSSTPYMVPM
jgi:hypothetical protein